MHIVHVQVVAVESNQAAVDKGMNMIRSSLDIIAKKSVTKGTSTEEAAKAHTDAVLARLTTSVDKKALKDCDIVVEVSRRALGVMCRTCLLHAARLRRTTPFARNSASALAGDH
jgi:3-hydroxyacyl-CoA dehydrogenase